MYSTDTYSEKKAPNITDTQNILNIINMFRMDDSVFRCAMCISLYIDLINFSVRSQYAMLLIMYLAKWKENDQTLLKLRCEKLYDRLLSRLERLKKQREAFHNLDADKFTRKYKQIAERKLSNIDTKISHLESIFEDPNVTEAIYQLNLLRNPTAKNKEEIIKQLDIQINDINYGSHVIHGFLKAFDARRDNILDMIDQTVTFNLRNM